MCFRFSYFSAWILRWISLLFLLFFCSLYFSLWSVVGASSLCVYVSLCFPFSTSVVCTVCRATRCPLLFIFFLRLCFFLGWCNGCGSRKPRIVISGLLGVLQVHGGMGFPASTDVASSCRGILCAWCLCMCHLYRLSCFCWRSLSTLRTSTVESCVFLFNVLFAWLLWRTSSPSSFHWEMFFFVTIFPLVVALCGRQ